MNFESNSKATGSGNGTFPKSSLGLFSSLPQSNGLRSEGSAEDKQLTVSGEQFRLREPHATDQPPI
jgi:hypothetical protein